MSLDVDDKIYTERKIITGVLLGGPIAGGYYFWRTFNALGMPKHGNAAIIVALIVLVGTGAAAFVPALDRVPNGVFYAIQTGLSIGAIRGYLATHIDAHIEASKAVYSWGNTILVAVISATITLGSLFALFYATADAFDNRTTRYFGELKHEIMFDPANINEAEVQRIAAALTSTTFFDQAVKKTVDVEKSDNRFIITTYCNETARQPEVMEIYKDLRSDLQRSFPANPIVLDMVIGTPDERIARLE